MGDVFAVRAITVPHIEARPPPYPMTPTEERLTAPKRDTSAISESDAVSWQPVTYQYLTPTLSLTEISVGSISL